MPPKKTVIKRNYVGESSAAASKRRRIQFQNPPQTTTEITNGLNFSPPSPMSDFQAEENHQVPIEEQLMSLLNSQQNYIINHHINEMQQSMEQFWRSKVSEELQRSKEIEAKLMAQEQQANLFRSMYYHYEQRSFHLEEMLRKSLERERYVSTGPNEVVNSCYFDPKTIAQKMDMNCKNCKKRPANMISLPCMHLCVCLLCERRVKICPICGVQKIDCVLINPPLLP